MLQEVNKDIKSLITHLMRGEQSFSELDKNTTE